MFVIVRIVRRSIRGLARTISPSWEVLRWFASSARRSSLEPGPTSSLSNQEGGAP